MDKFDRSMATDMIEDALEAVGDPVGRGIAIGLCSAFYLCGMIEPAEWERYQECILENSPPGKPDYAASAPPLPTPDTLSHRGYPASTAARPRVKTRSG